MGFYVFYTDVCILVKINDTDFSTIFPKCIIFSLPQGSVLGRQEEPGYDGLRRVVRGHPHRGEPLRRAQPHLPGLVVRHVVTQVNRLNTFKHFLYSLAILTIISRMLARCSRPYEKVTDVADLKTRFESLSLSNDITQILVLDNFTHRLIGERETISNLYN